MENKIQPEVKVSEHEKLIKINLLILIFGGAAYSLIYFLAGDFIFGITILLSTAFMVVTVKVLQSKVNEDITIYFLTFVQFTIITLFGLVGGEFAGGYALILAAIAMNAVYFKKKIIIIQWGLTDLVIVASLFFYDSLYNGISISFLIRSVFGLNFSIFFLYILLTFVVRFKVSAAEKEKTSEQLLVQVEAKMKEQEESARRIQQIFDGIKLSSDNLKITSDQMLNVAGDLSANATNQTSIIEDIVSKSADMAKEISSTKEIALDTSKMVSNNAIILAESNDSMSEAVMTIGEMESSSRKIITIIKQIEDISFQTNLLALNASIEAARAGSAGKGFAVVAEEVQTLAAKSAEAASASSDLVNQSINIVQTGSGFIKNAAQQLENVISESNLTANKVEEIYRIIENQVNTVEEITAQMNNFMQVIAQTSFTAEQSNEMANDISIQVTSINHAISG